MSIFRRKPKPDQTTSERDWVIKNATEERVILDPLLDELITATLEAPPLTVHHQINIQENPVQINEIIVPVFLSTEQVDRLRQLAPYTDGDDMRTYPAGSGSLIAKWVTEILDSMPANVDRPEGHATFVWTGDAVESATDGETMEVTVNFSSPDDSEALPDNTLPEGSVITGVRIRLGDNTLLEYPNAKLTSEARGEFTLSPEPVPGGEVTTSAVFETSVPTGFFPAAPMYDLFKDPVDLVKVITDALADSSLLIHAIDAKDFAKIALEAIRGTGFDIVPKGTAPDNLSPLTWQELLEQLCDYADFPTASDFRLEWLTNGAVGLTASNGTGSIENYRELNADDDTDFWHRLD